jgi:hypothetical protein
MTEKRWLDAKHPFEILPHAGCRSARKRRLLACACARRVFGFIGDAHVLAMIETAERYADNQATEADLRAAHKQAVRRFDDRQEWEGFTKAAKFAIRAGFATATKSFVLFKDVVEEAQDAMEALVTPDTPGAGSSLRIISGGMGGVKKLLNNPKWGGARAIEALAQCALVREIFGNPFRPPAIDPGRLGRDAPAIARSIYDDRAFDRLPNLADALDEAGCVDAEILGHCRSEGDHVRGCWVVDAVLGLA